MKRVLIVALLLVSTLAPTIQAQTLSLSESWDMKEMIASYDNGEVILTKPGWDEHISINGLGSPLESKIDDKVILEYGFAKIELYTIPGVGFEYMIIFPDRPSNPRVSLPVESEGLTWYYQPPLNEIHTQPGWTVNATHAYDETGMLRYSQPLNVVGSYAVYGSKSGNHYTTGKFGHIYRPYIYDSIGAGMYVDMVYDGEYLHIDLDDTWLKAKKRVYPVYLDPTLGKTDVGASNVDFAGAHIRASNGTTSAVGGTLDSVTFYAGAVTGWSMGWGGVYFDNGTLVEGEVVGTNVTTLTWYTVNMLGTTNLLGNTLYWAAGQVNATSTGGTVRFRGDWIGSPWSRGDTTFTVGAWDDPESWFNYNYWMSVYCNYTEPAGNNNPSADWYSPANDTRYNPSASVTFYWNFTDPDGGDTQSAYELEIDNNTAFSSPDVDTNKQVSGNEYHTATIPAVVDLYYVRVRVWDNHDAVGAWNHSLQIIVDQINVTSLVVTDNRINVGATGVITPSGVHVYDSAVWNGSATMNDTLSKAAVALYGYNVSSVTDTDYSLTSFTQSAADVYIIFDRIKVLTLESNDTTPAVNDYVLLNASLELEYDNHALGNGDTVNFTNSVNPPSTWNAGTSRFEETETRAVDATVNYNLITASEATYGITVVNMNGQSVSVTWGSPGILLIYVVDGDGVSIEGAFISVWDSAGDLSYTGDTNSSGYLDLGAVANGNYTIQASYPGYGNDIDNHVISIPQTVNKILYIISEPLGWAMFAFIILAAISNYFGLFVAENPESSILGLSFSTLFWIAALIQNIYDSGASGSGLWWLYLFPITINIMMIMQRGSEYLETGFNYKEDSWK